jgi:hypothetical protein
MPKIRKLKFSGADADYYLIGISCHLKDYRIVYNVNKELRLDLKKLNDFMTQEEKTKLEMKYSFYHYKDSDHLTDYFFISNHHPESKLIKELKQTDYFLLIKGDVGEKNLTTMISSINKIPSVLTAFRVDFSKIKNFSPFLEDLELHML